MIITEWRRIHLLLLSAVINWGIHFPCVFDGFSVSYLIFTFLSFWHQYMRNCTLFSLFSIWFISLRRFIFVTEIRREYRPERRYPRNGSGEFHAMPLWTQPGQIIFTLWHCEECKAYNRTERNGVEWNADATAAIQIRAFWFLNSAVGKHLKWTTECVLLIMVLTFRRCECWIQIQFFWCFAI